VTQVQYSCISEQQQLQQRRRRRRQFIRWLQHQIKYRWTPPLDACRVVTFGGCSFSITDGWNSAVFFAHLRTHVWLTLTVARQRRVDDMETKSVDDVTLPLLVEEPADTKQASCDLYDFVVCTVVIGLVCVFGLAGNITSFFVLCKHKTETATIFLLQCMAVFDSLLLLSTLLLYVLPAVYPYTGSLQVSHSTLCFSGVFIGEQTVMTLPQNWKAPRLAPYLLNSKMYGCSW